MKKNKKFLLFIVLPAVALLAICCVYHANGDQKAVITKYLPALKESKKYQYLSDDDLIYEVKIVKTNKIDTVIYVAGAGKKELILDDTVTINSRFNNGEPLIQE